MGQQLKHSETKDGNASVFTGAEAPLPVKLGGGVPGTGGWTEASKTVSSAGTPEVLGGDVSYSELIIADLPTNTGEVLFGFASGNGTQALALPAVLQNGNLNEIYIDVGTDGEGVRYAYR